MGYCTQSSSFFLEQVLFVGIAGLRFCAAQLYSEILPERNVSEGGAEEVLCQ